VLLKPNVGRETDPKQAINTNPLVVEAVFEFLEEKYDAQIFLGDSPIIMTDSKKAFKQSGFERLMEEKKITWLNLDEKKPKTLPIKDGILLKKIRVTGYWEEFDYIISIPVLKMHMHTGATLSFKNCKGLIYKRDKIKLHHLEAIPLIKKMREEIPKVKELDVAIADLYQVIKPDLAVIDASYVIGGMGPSAGEKTKLDTIIASDNFLAADIVALALTQPKWTLKDVPHLYLISKEIKKNDDNSFFTSVNDIQNNPKDFTSFVHEIAGPPDTVTIKYPNVILYSKNSCSSCVSTVSLFLKNNKDLIDKNFTKENPLRLVIGTGNKDIKVYEDTFLVGNCTMNLRDKNGIFIRGCPPVQSVLLKNVSEYLSQLEKDSEGN